MEIKSGEKLDLVVVVVIWRRDLLKNSKGVRVAAAFTAAFCSISDTLFANVTSCLYCLNSSHRLINTLSMASSFFSFSSFRSASKVNTTIQPAPPFSRTMASGRCTAIIAAGTLGVPCPCPRGEFEVPLATRDVGCKVCAHPLSQHEDAGSTNSLPFIRMSALL